MDTTEALGYLKGLLDGLDLDENKKETKVFKAVVFCYLLIISIKYL